jgi:cytochrome oxidase assembly protein ShyY1
VRSLRFLFSRRWILFAITVALLAALAWRLGEWQFHRLEARKATNAIIERNLAGGPSPVDQVLAKDRPVDKQDQWRRVTATGTYDTADTVIVRYQTRDGAAGVDVVVPLVTASGQALLVDRGWLASENRGADVSDVPPPPSGSVTVTGWVRMDASGSSTTVTENSVRSISSVAIGAAIGTPLYAGFVDLEAEAPAPATALTPTEMPELDNGPHFFYGLQWWFFALLALFGFCYLAYDEWRGGPPLGSRRGSQTAQQPAVDGDRRPGDPARGR